MLCYVGNFCFFGVVVYGDGCFGEDFSGGYDVLVVDVDDENIGVLVYFRFCIFC